MEVGEGGLVFVVFFDVFDVGIKIYYFKKYVFIVFLENFFNNIEDGYFRIL